MTKQASETELRDSVLYFLTRDEETGAVTVDLIREKFTAHNAQELHMLIGVFNELSQRMNEFLRPCSGEDASVPDCEAITIEDMQPLWAAVCGRRKRKR